jgi:hypothetical protein
VRQIPADQIIHIKGNVVSVEKRGRSILYSVFGWIKRITDTFNAQVLGEQLRASFVWDDTIDGGQGDVDAHAAKYNYIPVAPSIFVHNNTVERKALAPMAQRHRGPEQRRAGAPRLRRHSDRPRERTSSTSSRPAAATVRPPSSAASPSRRSSKTCRRTCQRPAPPDHRVLLRAGRASTTTPTSGEVIFPSVQKDALNDRLKAIATCESMGWFNHERAATMAASEMEADSYDAETELSKIADETSARLAAGLPGAGAPPPAGRYGPAASGPGGSPDEPDRADKNPIHGKGKKDIVRQHKNL